MAAERQQTLASEVVLEGVGVHSGQQSELRIMPAAESFGVRFRRADLPGTPEVPARLEYVKRTELGTTLGRDDAEVMTVEHVLAALVSLEVDNALIDLDGPEPPILDGSFAPYVSAVMEAGLAVQRAPASVIKLTAPVTAGDERSGSYVAVPDPRFRVSATIDYPHPVIRRQYGSYCATGNGFAEDLANARTFGFKADADALHARGRALGASLDNTVVLDEERVLNDELRFADEFVRHKAGDIVGDMALLGSRFRGHVVADRPSHTGNVKLAAAIGEAQTRNRGAIDIRHVMGHLPHRYPMLLVDRVLEFESRKRIVGLKNVTINEPFFGGHFPEHPIMPGVLIIEAMGQVGGLLLMDAVDDPEGKVVYFMSLDNVKWRRPVVPGDQLVFELEMLHFRRQVCKMRGTGAVDGQVVAQAEMTARIVDK